MTDDWTYNGRFITADGERPLYRKDMSPQERERISLLIAAAPDLLRACQELLQAMRDYELAAEESPTGKHRQMMRRARAAIAKATCKPEQDSAS